MAEVKVILVKSPYGRNKAHTGTLRALGLSKIGQSRTHKVTPVLSGMLRSVAYLVKTEEVGK